MAFFRRRTITTSGRSYGIIVLAIWLILQGIVPLLNIHISGLPTIQAILAVAAGVLLLIGR